MKIFGWIFLLACFIDAATSIAATFMPALGDLSNLISTPVCFSAVAVFVLACMNRLRPRRVFLTLSAYYGGLMAFGFCLGVALVIKLGPSAAGHKVTIQFLREQFSWYECVHWLLIVPWLVLSIYGILAYQKWQTADESEPPVVTGPPPLR